MIISDYKNLAEINQLFPEIEPFETGFIKVDDIHEIYFELSGNPKGEPVVFLHGGPGGGVNPKSRRFFDPAHYKIVAFDQRGAGRSKPIGETRNNTTELLVEDIETLRKHLGINTWHVFGGSWGSTLSLCYAISHADKIKSLTLRGIFMLRKKEVDWFINGMRRIFPDAYDRLVSILSDDEKKDVMQSFQNRINCSDKSTRIEAAKAWSMYEQSSSQLMPIMAEEIPFTEEIENQAYCITKIELHYMLNNLFTPDDYILSNINKIRHIPATIVQGRYDIVCPIESAYELHKAWPEAKFMVVPDAGHSSGEPGMTHELIKATNEFKNIN